MCGRKYSPQVAEIERAWHIGARTRIDLSWLVPLMEQWGIEDKPLPDASPTQVLPVFRIHPERGPEIVRARWALVPAWWKEPKLPTRTFNATVEKIKARSGMWRTPFLRQRCLVPVVGFYEWQLQRDGKTKVRHFIRLRDAAIFSLAGLWDAYKQPDGTLLESYTVVTCPANPLMAKIHNHPQNSDGPRMPVILTGETQMAWCDPAADLTPEDRLGLLTPLAPEAMRAYPVKNTAEKPDKMDLIEPIGEDVEA